MTTDKMQRHFEALNGHIGVQKTSLALRIDLDYYAS